MTYQLIEIARMELPSEPLIMEGSYITRDVGAHASTMILYKEIQDGGDPHFSIEWDIPSLEMTEQIGLELEGKRVVGYDGVMSFPHPAYKFLRGLGYRIARDVE